ncbi:amino acid ABC transporter substrate-binding protein, PAAT family [Cryobacterium psychrotolerans]|uniref:Amino acid ABC transporter substrate-binding protein, PAAT family n=1 Tax=Cryobacterium psychrotolerans TaxID=386301 RepID=A0A1G9G8X4_9MICO|nr:MULTISPECIES: ABC transporter substrate-binding protein [Cryobacterium]TFD42355.1 ABC transporter substrate-binding protein [Cryobacterium sp. TMT1-2-1]TFD83831.1 ABC transporter substrate-binding protein [Cryobacterium psychrotolerans]SDK97015.1 amino acid ABC transporter substrate-binding protein, PAAT family [Cryobacterium psychrotolerans]
MRSMNKRNKAVVLGVTFAVAATMLAGCSAGGAASSADKAPAKDADSALRGMLPADIKEAGVLKIGTEAFYPPFEYLDADNTTVIGLDMALFQAIGDELGLTVDITNMAFDGLLPALDAKRIDVVVAAMTDTKARQAKYDFVDYFLTGQGIVVPAGNPKSIKGIEDMCGLKVAALEASTQVSLLEKFNTEECADDPIVVTALATDADAMLQVRSGRADASFSQDAVARFNAQAEGGSGKFEIGNDEPLLPVVMGPMFAKEDSDLRDAVKATIEKLIADGTYKSILDEHDLGSGAVTEVTVNGGTL